MHDWWQVFNRKSTGFLSLPPYPLPAWLTVPVPCDLFYACLVKLSKCHQNPNGLPTQGVSEMNQRGVAASRDVQTILKREIWTTTLKRNIDPNLIVLFPRKKKKIIIIKKKRKLDLNPQAQWQSWERILFFLIYSLCFYSLVPFWPIYKKNGEGGCGIKRSFWGRQLSVIVK